MNPDNGLFQIVYTSELCGDPTLRDDVLQSISRCSQRNNPSNRVTGAMLVVGMRVIQVLEGPLSSLEPLLERIQTDNRHDAMEELYRSSSTVRAFPDWVMRVGAVDASAPDADKIRIILDAYRHTFRFDLKDYVDIAHRQLGIRRAAAGSI